MFIKKNMKIKCFLVAVMMLLCSVTVFAVPSDNVNKSGLELLNEVSKIAGDVDKITLTAEQTLEKFGAEMLQEIFGEKFTKLNKLNEQRFASYSDSNCSHVWTVYSVQELPRHGFQHQNCRVELNVFLWCYQCDNAYKSEIWYKEGCF